MTFLSWVDYSSLERQRMRQAVALFKESDTRDELGLGSIRDAIADELFPGTSTIQTRLAYTLMVPWGYRILERERATRAGNVEARARSREIALIGVLRESEDTSGLIGGRAGAALQRLPSSVYWFTLTRWGIFQPRWSLEDYHRQWDSLGARRAKTPPTDDAGIVPDQLVTWHPRLPEAPEDFPEKASFELRREDAVFLQDRIVDTCTGSLLRHAILPKMTRPDLSQEAPWDAFVDLPSVLASRVAVARRFAWLMQGAAIVYNLALARIDHGNDELVAKTETALTAWADDAEREGVARWDLDELWAFCEERVHGALGNVLTRPRVNVSPGTREFVARWQELVRAEGYHAIGGSAEAHRLIEEREVRIKKEPRSRFRNKRARDLWGGSSGTALMTYRWRTARTFLKDLYRGGGH
jgi:hypothetical protein